MPREENVGFVKIKFEIGKSIENIESFKNVSIRFFVGSKGQNKVICKYKV